MVSGSKVATSIDWLEQSHQTFVCGISLYPCSGAALSLVQTKPPVLKIPHKTIVLSSNVEELMWGWNSYYFLSWCRNQLEHPIRIKTWGQHRKNLLLCTFVHAKWGREHSTRLSHPLQDANLLPTASSLVIGARAQLCLEVIKQVKEMEADDKKPGWCMT